MVARLPHPLAGEVPVVASPMKFSRTRVEHGRPPPLLGEHTEAVLRDVLGSSDAEIARCRRRRDLTTRDTSAAVRPLSSKLSPARGGWRLPKACR
jgi:hypothetical protein